MSLNYLNKYSLAWDKIKNLLQNADPADVELIGHLVSQTEIKTCISKKKWNYIKRIYDNEYICPCCFNVISNKNYHCCPWCGQQVNFN